MPPGARWCLSWGLWFCNFECCLNVIWLCFGFFLDPFFCPSLCHYLLHMDTVFAGFKDNKIKRQMANPAQNCSLRLWDTLSLVSKTACEIQHPKVRNAQSPVRMWPVWFTVALEGHKELQPQLLTQINGAPCTVPQNSHPLLPPRKQIFPQPAVLEHHWWALLLEP